mmetsp:Transcript_17673/g.47152  ORF Transcript_17673/g.47152 Transcript_17673/m.47152 type:complete len:205 (+) Transcript_17673:1722-2336(+)
MSSVSPLLNASTAMSTSLPWKKGCKKLKIVSTTETNMPPPSRFSGHSEKTSLRSIARDSEMLGSPWPLCTSDDDLLCWPSSSISRALTRSRWCMRMYALGQQSWPSHSGSFDSCSPASCSADSSPAAAVGRATGDAPAVCMSCIDMPSSACRASWPAGAAAGASSCCRLSSRLARLSAGMAGRLPPRCARAPGGARRGGRAEKI